MKLWVCNFIVSKEMLDIFYMDILKQFFIKSRIEI